MYNNKKIIFNICVTTNDKKMKITTNNKHSYTLTWINDLKSQTNWLLYEIYITLINHKKKRSIPYIQKLFRKKYKP